MDLAQLLKESRTSILSDALQALTRATLPRYKASNAEQNNERLAKLFDLTEQCVDTRTITAKLQPLQYPEALGLASTVLGAGKQALALEWVSLAGHHHAVQTLDLSALFR